MTSIPNSDPIATTIASARADIHGAEYVPVADCVDWLLDCLNVAARPDVKDVIIRILPDFTSGNLRQRSDFEQALNEVELALEVDAAFDSFGLDPAT